MDGGDDTFPVHAGSGLTDTGTRVLKHGDTFVVSERHGDVIAALESQLGLYHDGTRHLSHVRLRVGNVRLLLLSSSVTADNVLLVVELMNPDIYEGERLVVEHGNLHVRRERLILDGTLYERIDLTSYAASTVRLDVDVETAADFIDLFEVRGARREKRGRRLDPETAGSEAWWRYDGLDGRRRTTRVRFEPAPTSIDARAARYRVELDKGITVRLEMAAQCNAQAGADVLSFDEALARARAELDAHLGDDCAVTTSNDLFDAWIGRAQADLRMMVTETEMGRYPYAGVPWFSTPFGRDGILTALEALWMNPTLAAGVLDYLAARQARDRNDRSDAEPGKILHETRGGEMAALGEVPFGKYYGSIDSTPLFALLAARYHCATGDDARIERLWPALEAALGWIDRDGDRDGDGFVEYGRRTPVGLLQQGWKDSNDSVFHADGSDAVGPIALCEVQGYVYAAKRECAWLADRLGKPELAARLRSAAAALRERFDGAFWCEDLGTYALALDGDKKPCRVRSSNAGHCLWTEIALPERAATVADTLLSQHMFSGWGVRTLAAGEPRYNPMSYHNGSIWPHDNALVADGLARYGLNDHVERLFTGLFGVATEVELHRLPELFCGFDRRTGEGPTLYPVACAPQAWASASVFMLLGAVLGLRVEAAKNRLALERPFLPPWLDVVRLTNLRVGHHRVDLTLRRYPEDVALTVDKRTGPIRVVVVK